jgi:hypothetical protein
VDWTRNATWLIRVPLGTGHDAYSSVEVTLAADVAGELAAPGAQVLAQVVTQPDSERPPAVLPRTPAHSALVLPQGHAMAIKVQPRGWGVGSGRAEAFVQLLAGQHPPWRLEAAAGKCGGAGGGDDQPPLLPAFVALGEDGDGAVDAVRAGEGGVRLWAPGVAHRPLLMILDPRCAWELR